jgi:uroporphyrinogen III methyltransferase/synthase
VRASRGRDVLPTELRAAGALLEELVVYQNTDVAEFGTAERELLASGRVDWIALSSPSIARSVARLLPDAAKPHLGTRTRLAAISSVTEAAAREAGLPVSTVARTYTWDGLFDAILEAQEGTSRDGNRR